MSSSVKVERYNYNFVQYTSVANVGMKYSPNVGNEVGQSLILFTNLQLNDVTKMI